jgi:hypothetical protein
MIGRVVVIGVRSQTAISKVGEHLRLVGLSGTVKSQGWLLPSVQGRIYSVSRKALPVSGAKTPRLKAMIRLQWRTNRRTDGFVEL